MDFDTAFKPASEKGVQSLSECMECLYGPERTMQEDNLQKTLFELYNQNRGLANEYLSQAFEALEKEGKISSMANDYWWTRFGSVVIDLNCGSWLLEFFEEQGYDVVLSPYYTAIQALEIEKQDAKNGQKDAEIYLRNRVVEISEPARLICKKMRNYVNGTEELT